MEFNYSCLDMERGKIRVSVSVESEENDVDEIDLALKKVVSDALQYLGKENRELHIQIKKLNAVDGKIKYTILEQKKSPIHKIALHTLPNPVSHIIRLPEVPDMLTLVELFTPAKVKAATRSEKIKAILSDYFHKMIESSALLSKIFKALKENKEAVPRPVPGKILGDFNIMAEICGAPPVDGMDLQQSLKYLSETLKSGRDGTIDSDIAGRVEQASDRASTIVRLRKHFSKSGQKKFIENLHKSIQEINGEEKILFPIGYYNGGVWVESLLQVSKDSNGTYTIEFICTDEETRCLFDREEGERAGVQSLKRTILNVQEADLLASMTTFVELQTSPSCVETESEQWKEIFLHTLNFHGAEVEVSEISEPFRKDISSGKLTGVLSYLKSEGDEVKSKRLDLAIRLRMFLNIVTYNTKALENPAFWKSARATALHLAAMIEKERDVLGSPTEQAVELHEVFSQVTEMLKWLESHPPKTEDITSEKLPNKTGAIELEKSTPTPPLKPLKKHHQLFPRVDPSFSLLDPADPFKSVSDWGSRVQALIGLGQIEEAANEAKLIVQMLPKINDPFWKTLDLNQAEVILKAFNSIGEAIARDSLEKEQPSIQSATTMTILNYYAISISCLWHELNDTSENLLQLQINPFIAANKRTSTAVARCDISEKDRKTLSELEQSIVLNYGTKLGASDSLKVAPYNDRAVKVMLKGIRLLPAPMQTLLNLNQLHKMALGLGRGLHKNVNQNQPLHFTMPLKSILPGNIKIKLVGNSVWENDILALPSPLAYRAPPYASDLAHEIVSRYATEFCCLGCIRDNCPSYTATSLERQRFLPLYLIHNNVDTYCEELTKRKQLHRDELIDLLYMQQTNQNARDLYSNWHKGVDGFEIANGFIPSDNILNLQNAFMTYLKHPHFFKQPDLRWLFEHKLFRDDPLSKMLAPDQFSTYKPFLLSAFKKLKKEASIALSSGDKEMGAYFLYLSGKLRETVENTTLTAADQTELLDCLPRYREDVFLRWAAELIGKKDESVLGRQMMIFPLMLQNYYKKFTANPQDPCFDSQRDLELILGASAHIESNDALKLRIDPELYDHARSVVSFALMKAKARVDQEPEEERGFFINKILLRSNPALAGLHLSWNPTDFPTFFAKDDEGEAIYFDLTTGQVLFGESRKDELPDNIKSQRIVQRLFHIAIDDNWSVTGTDPRSDERIIAYTHDKYPEFRIVVKRKKTASASSRPNIEVERRITTSTGTGLWTTYASFDTQERLRRKEELPDAPDLPPAIALIVRERTCWIDKEHKQLFVLEEGNDTPYAEMAIENHPLLGFEITDLHLIGSGQHLLSAGKEALAQFSAIENPQFINVFGSKQKAESLEYPRHILADSGAPLSYQLEKDGTHCLNFPEYSLAMPGERPGSSDPSFGATPLPLTFDGFHLLKKDGDEKVLIPLCGFEQSFTASGDTLPTSKTVFSNRFEQTRIYEYSVDRETNRLKATSGDAYAYLAFIAMAHSDFAACQFYLAKARTTGGYGENYIKILQMADQWNDPSPNGIAAKLKFQIFNEKVYQDEEIRLLREGKTLNAQEIETTKSRRLMALAKQFEKYKELQASRIPGETGLDPALDLTIEEENQASLLINQWIDQFGDRLINTQELTPISAEMVSLQSFLENPEKNTLGIRNSSVVLWMLGRGSSVDTTLTLDDPLELAYNFRGYFNKILSLEPVAPEFKKIKQKLLFLSKIPEEDEHLLKQLIKSGLQRLKTKFHIKTRDVSEFEAQAIQVSQTYLLKLIQVKEESGRNLRKINKVLGDGQKLPRLTGSLSEKERQKKAERFFVLQKEYDSDAIEDPQRAQIVSERLVELFEEQDPHNIRSLAKRVLKYLDRRDPASSFPDGMKTLLSSAILGGSASNDIDRLDSVFDILDPVEIDEEVKEEAPIPQPERVTIRERFGPLLEKSSEDRSKAIAVLEKSLADRTEMEPYPLITTDPSQIEAVIGNEKAASYAEDFFTITELPKPDLDQEMFEELKGSEEKAYARVAERHQQDLEEHLNKSRWEASISKEQTEQLKASLNKEKRKLAKEIDGSRSTLLATVDRFNTPAGTLALRRLLGKGVKPSLDVLIAMWRREETAKPWEEHPFSKLGIAEMNAEELKSIDDLITSYLLAQTKMNHLNFVLDQADKYLSSCGEEDNSFGDQPLANQLFEGTQTKRQYASGEMGDLDFRDLLYVEYTQKIIMYADQIQTLREMSHDPNAVRQLRMGRGKTEVIMPILAKRKATGKNLVMLILPEELYEANCRGLDAKNRVLFGRTMQRFEFSRKTNISIESLEKIYQELLETVRDAGFAMTTRRSLLSLKDSFDLLLYQLSETQNEERKSELIGQIRAMSKIIALMQNSGEGLGDEVDSCLDVRKEVNFALGAAERIDPLKGEVAGELFAMILDEKEGGGLSEVQKAMSLNTQAAISLEGRKEFLKKLIYRYYKAHKQELSAFDRHSFVKYIMDDPEQIAIMDQVFAMKEENPLLFKQIAALKAIINQGLGTTLGRIGNVNYGRDPVTGHNTIPYKASNTPSINSEFDNDIERICFTYQDYLQNGVTYKQVYQIVAKMQHKAIEQLRGTDPDEMHSLLDMEAADEFQQFLRDIDPENRLPASSNLATMCNPKMIKTLVDTLNGSKKGLLRFCKKVVIGEMRQYLTQVNASSTETPELLKNFSGFTGTPWNIHTYHDKINAEVNLGVDGSTWALMLERDIPVHTFDFDAEQPIDSLLSALDIVGQKQAVIDTGAYLRGTSNAEFADKALKKAEQEGKELEAGIYFNEAGIIVKKLQGSTAQPIETAPATDQMKTITLYDQAHTVGADIRQGKHAKAIVTIGENTFIRDLFQAVWRLRQLHLDQRVELAFSEALKQRIVGDVDRPMTREEMRKYCKEIHKFCLKNEAKREAEDNFKAEKEKIHGFAKRKLLSGATSAINNGASDEVILKMADEFASLEKGFLLKKRAGEEEYDQYARLKKLESPRRVFRRLKSAEKKKCLNIAEHFKAWGLKEAEQQFRQAAEEVGSRRTPPLDWFLNKVDSGSEEGGEVEIEQEVAQEMELMVETETEQEMEQEVSVERGIPIAQTGHAGHGDVVPISRAAIAGIVNTFLFAPNSARQVSNALPFFSKNILCSAVFERNLPGAPTAGISPQSFFYSNRKTISQVLISKGSNGQWSVLIPTIHEAHGPCNQFVNSTKERSVMVGLTKGQPLVLYKSGTDRREDLPFKTKEDMLNFYYHYVQCKLLQGEVDFETAEEKYALKQFLVQSGSDDFREYFETYILSSKPARFGERYVDSSLFSVFKELEGTAKLTAAEALREYPVEEFPWTPPEEIPEPPPEAVKPVFNLSQINLKLFQMSKTTAIPPLEEITKFLEEQIDSIRVGKTKEKTQFVEIIKEMLAKIDDESKKHLIALAGRCVAKADNWSYESLKFHAVDPEISSAALADLLNQGILLDGLDLKAWPLIEKYLLPKEPVEPIKDAGDNG